MQINQEYPNVDASVSYNRQNRLLAWNLLLKYKITKLPISPKAIIQSQKIELWPYSYFANQCECSIQEVVAEYDKDGFLMKFQDQFIIVYNEAMPEKRITWTLAHELSHYLLGHANGFAEAGTSCGVDINIDAQANNLAAKILCPSIVLHLCAVSSPRELSKLCSLSLEASSIQFAHLQELRRRNKFLTHPLEKQIMHQFSPFICSYLCEKLGDKLSHGF